MRLARGALILPAALLAGCAAPVAPLPGQAASCAAGGTAMARVELIFGLGLERGGGVSEAGWLAFLEREVTPRFPDGLTAYDAYGQWRHPEKGIVRLRSKVLQIWYAPSTEAEDKIQTIREAFKTAFHQMSVMRVDGMDCVSF